MALITRYVNTASTTGGDGTTNNITGSTRAYVSLNAAEAGEQQDLTGNTLEILCTGSAADLTQTQFGAGWITTSSSFITVKPNPSDINTTGIYNTALYRVESLLSYGRNIQNLSPCDHLRIEGIQGITSGVQQRCFHILGNGDSRVVGCIVKGISTSINSIGIDFGANTAGDFTAINNVVFDTFAHGLYKGNYIGGGTGRVFVYNNTVDNCGTGLRMLSGHGAGTRAFNNLLTNNTTDYSVTGSITHDDNVTSDASSPDSGHASKTIVYTDVEGKDFSTSDVNVVGLGTDLSSDAGHAFSTDILGISREAVWDIGAFQSGAGGSEALSLNVNTPSLSLTAPDSTLLLDATLALNANTPTLSLSAPDATLLLDATIALNVDTPSLNLTVPDAILLLDAALALNVSTPILVLDAPNPILVLGSTLALNVSTPTLQLDAPGSTLLLDATLALNVDTPTLGLTAPNSTLVLGSTLALNSSTPSLLLGVPDAVLLLDATLSLLVDTPTLTFDLPGVTLVFGSTIALNVTTPSLALSAPDAVLTLILPFSIGAITAGEINPGDVVTIDLVNGEAYETLSCLAGGITIQSQSTGSLSFVCIEPPLFGNQSLNYLETVVLTVDSAGQTDTINMVITPRANEAFGQIGTIDPDGFFIDDIGLEVGHWSHFKNFTGDIIVDPTDGSFTSTIASSVDYATFNGGDWSVYITEVIAVPSLLLDLVVSSTPSLSLSSPVVSLVLYKVINLMSDTPSLSLAAPDGVLVLSEALLLNATTPALSLSSPDATLALTKTLVLNASTPSLNLSSPDVLLVLESQIPVIQLIGGDMVVYLNTSFADPGYSANDYPDGDISADISITGDVVDVTNLGNYTRYYDVTDSDLNPAIQRSRTISVVPQPSGDNTRVMRSSLRSSLNSKMNNGV